MSVPEVDSTSSAALISCPQYLFHHSGGETGGFSLSYHYDSSLLLTNSSKIICRSNRKGKTFSLNFFLAPIPLLCIWNVCQNRKKRDADVFYLVFHLRLASYFQTELKEKATRV